MRNRTVWSQHCVAALSHETGYNCLFLQFSIDNKSHQGNHPMPSCPCRFLSSTWNGASRNPYASSSHRYLTAGMWIAIKTRNFKLRRAEMPGNVAHSLKGDLAEHGIFGSSEQNHVCAFVEQVIRRQFSFAVVAFTMTIDKARFTSVRPVYAHYCAACLIDPLWSYCLRNLFQAPLPTFVQPLY